MPVWFVLGDMPVFFNRERQLCMLSLVSPSCGGGDAIATDTVCARQGRYGRRRQQDSCGEADMIIPRATYERYSLF